MPMLQSFNRVSVSVNGQQMRRRVIEAPIGSKMGYHELGDEKEEGDMEWMLGEASQLSGAGSRGSRNWVLAIMLPILVNDPLLPQIHGCTR